MKTFMSILLTQFILLQAFHIGYEDVAKVETLLEHASYHQKQFGDSFIEFLIEHYSNENDSSIVVHKEHQNLPFKKNLNHFGNSPFLISYDIGCFELTITVTQAKENTFFYTEPVTELSYSKLLQPPKFA